MDEEGVMDGNTGKIQEEDRKTNNEDGGKTNGGERSLGYADGCRVVCFHVQIPFFKSKLFS